MLGLADRLASLVMRSPSTTSTAGMDRKLQKQVSQSYNYLEHKLKDALVQYLKAKDQQSATEGHPKIVHSFNQFWLQLPKLEEGFKVLERQLTQHTYSKDGPLSMKYLFEHAEEFGLSEESPALQRLCTDGPHHKCCETDFVGLLMVQLITHLTEPQNAAGLDPAVRLSLNCLEAAFSHFASARNGKLDRREVEGAMQQEGAKAHAKEGRQGHNSHRLAARLFDGLEWSHDNTISFEKFLRGITTMVREEFEEDGEPDPLLDEFNASRSSSASGMRAIAAAAAAAAAAGGSSARPSHNGGATRVMQMQAAEAGHGYGQPIARVSASGGSATGLKSCLRASSSGVQPQPQPHEL